MYVIPSAIDLCINWSRMNRINKNTTQMVVVNPKNNKNKQNNSKKLTAQQFKQINNMFNAMTKMRINPKKNKKQNSQIPRPIKHSALASTNYFKLLSNPFDKRYFGAKIPSWGHENSIGFHTRSVIAMVAGATQSNGLTVGLIPNLTQTVLACNANFTVAGAGLQYSPSNDVFQAVSTAVLSGNYSTYRIVAAGAKIRNRLASTLPPARITICKLPIVTPGPGPNFLNTIAVTGATATSFMTNQTVTLVTGGFQVANIDGYENTQVFTSQDILNSAVEVHFKPQTPDAFRIFSTGAPPSYSSGVTQETVVEVTTITGAIISGLSGGDALAGYDPTGQEMLVIQVDGCQNSITNLEIEFIIHYEATLDVVASDTTGTAFGGGGGAPESKSRFNLEDIVNLADSLPDYLTVAGAIGSALFPQTVGRVINNLKTLTNYSA